MLCKLIQQRNKVWETLKVIGMIFATIVIPIVIIYLIYRLISKYYSPLTIGKLTLQNIQEITSPLIKYYEVSWPKIVTKCYKCSNDFFNKKDVFIFLYKGKIRITLDFDHTTKDFGCYEFNSKEITTSYVEENGLVKTYLKAGKVEFFLGKRAKPFIKKCFTKSKCPCCGYYTFAEIERGYFSICSVCFWEDDLDQVRDPNNGGLANKVSLIEARKNYKEFGACEGRLVQYCRPPKENERRK